MGQTQGFAHGSVAFVMTINDCPPWDRLAQSGHAERSMRLRSVPNPNMFSFVVGVNPDYLSVCFITILMV